MCCSLKVVFFIRTLLKTHLRGTKMSNSSCRSKHVAVYYSLMTLEGAVGRGQKRGRRAPVGKEITEKQFTMKMMQIRAKRVMRSEHLEQPGAFPGGRDGGVGGCNHFQRVPGQGSEY